VAPFSWPPGPQHDPLTWHVVREGNALYVEPSRGQPIRLPLESVGAVRIVPLTSGNHHMQQTRGRWQVALQRADGDVLVGGALSDWQAARQLAQQVCDATGLSLDELSQRMFSRVGQFGPKTYGS
jgi:hypothetical protein